VILEARGSPRRASRTDFERRLAAALSEARLPVPVREFPVRRPDGTVKYVDLAYPEYLLAVEADSYRYHSSLKQWARDRVRNNELMALGWRVLPVTYEDLRANPAAVADQVRRCREACQKTLDNRG
jgi:very-short-patch-repair endonuclease